jgi:hypothetical protein
VQALGARVSTGSAVSSASALYEQRYKRLIDAIELREPDRLPTILFSHFWVATTYCKKLFDTVGDGGGFILDAGVGVPDEAKPENVLAMFELAKDCVY